MRPWKKVQQWKRPLTDQKKFDLQDIINKHQQSALLEANETIRVLEEQREVHVLLLGEHEKAIRAFEHQLQEQEQSQEKQVTNNNSINPEAEASDQIIEENGLQDEVEQLKRQLQERDLLIEKLQHQQQQQEEGESSSESVVNRSQEKTQVAETIQAEVTTLQAKVHSLTEENTEQQTEIHKLENILKELQEFHAEGSEEYPPATSLGLGIILEESEASLLNNSSEVSEAPDEICEHIDDSHDVLDNDTKKTSIEDSDEDLSFVEAGSETEAPAGRELGQPYTGMTLQGNQLVLLISSSPINRIIAANQSRLETILQGYLNLSSQDEVQVLDGCDRDPASVNLRNDLFRISGLRAQYPQLFLVNFLNNDISFVGDFDAIMELHDTQTFATTVGMVPF